MNTEQMLDFLSEIGRPRIARMDDGKWHAEVSFPSPKGVTAQVSSDFNLPTHTAALRQVIDRLKAMKSMGDGIDTAMKRISE